MKQNINCDSEERKIFLRSWNGEKNKENKGRKKDANLENGVKNLYENKKVIINEWEKERVEFFFKSKKWEK